MEFRDRPAAHANHTPVPRTRAESGRAADATDAETERRRSLDRRLSLWLARVERSLGQLADKGPDED